MGMRFWRKQQSPEELGRAPEDLLPGTTPLELADRVRTRLKYALTYGRDSRRGWRFWATTVRLAVLGLSAFATVTLGLASLTGAAAYGFIASALVTTVSAVEPFFNWRSRWVMADEAIAQWYTIEDELLLYVAGTRAEDLSVERITRLDEARQAVWDRFSTQWLIERRRPDAGLSAD